MKNTKKRKGASLVKETTPPSFGFSTTPSVHVPGGAFVRDPVGATGLDGGIQVSWARHLDDIRAAQRLRYQVFVHEMGARLATTAGNRLHATGGRYALCTMCIGVGQGIALILEKV